MEIYATTRCENAFQNACVERVAHGEALSTYPESPDLVVSAGLHHKFVYGNKEPILVRSKYYVSPWIQVMGIAWLYSQRFGWKYYSSILWLADNRKWEKCITISSNWLRLKNASAIELGVRQDFAKNNVENRVSMVQKWSWKMLTLRSEHSKKKAVNSYGFNN